jgi:hypothetical protein
VRAIGNAEFINGSANEFTEVFKINERKEAEVRLQSLADNLPGVFQYLIYTDGTDNLKYVTRGKEVGDFLQRKYYRTCS